MRGLPYVAISDPVQRSHGLSRRVGGDIYLAHLQRTEFRFRSRRSGFDSSCSESLKVPQDSLLLCIIQCLFHSYTGLRPKETVSFCFPPFSSFRRQDVLTLTPWLAPIVWEGTFNSEILDNAYKPLNLTIGVTAFAIGKYTRFVGRFLESAEKHFMKGYRVNYYIFTNDPQAIPRVQLQPSRRLSIVPIKKYSHWQEISMRRMEAINRHIAEMSHREVNYLFCLDIDMVFYNPWGAETLGELVAAIHPGYYKVPRSQFPYERRSFSAAFIPDGQGDFYYGGAVFGGLISQVYEFTRTCHMTILADKANGIMAAWQEESHLNRHFASHKPSKLLSPEYLWDDTKPKPPEDSKTRVDINLGKENIHNYNKHLKE
uniref:Globoside alpha-1,3-N-acetylgalactosaminyltransferase 1 (FORS blood group) n=1 Tax=Pelusios castaneus TaxID=367368 RepID=A0A8C8SNS7_9SAUR